MKNFTLKLLCLLAMAVPASLLAQIPKFTSLATAKATIYIDFDGENVTSGYWNGGATLNCSPASFTNTQIEEIYNRVSEDYRPFNIRITTDLDSFRTAPLNRRVRIIVTPTSAWRQGVGGIAYTGSFTWGDDTPAFVFSDRLANSPKYVAECVSHESGHTLGLAHQTKYDASCTLLETYNTGSGSATSEISWAPVMGNSYYKNMTGWNNGPTPSGCTANQDNLSIITSQNGFTYRVDDYTDATNNTATVLATSFTKAGIITTSTDKDAFKYTVSQTAHFHMEAAPYSIGANSMGANLDIQIQLYSGTNTLVRTFNPTTTMNVTIDTVLNAGSYYFVVSGVGNEFGTDYGSLGSYTMNGFQGALPIHDISLKGSVDKSTHNLSWNIVADEPIKAQVLEMSTDAVNFSPVTSISTLLNKYGYNTNQNTTIFYRLKVTSVIDQTAYSNVVALKSAAGSGKRFTVSTFVQNDLTVNATENYQYRLSDLNGRLIAGGIGQKGMNRINIANQAGGMYILQLINNNERQTERIIKQ
jgi:hypothetical protein